MVKLLRFLVISKWAVKCHLTILRAYCLGISFTDGREIRQLGHGTHTYIRDKNGHAEN